MDELLSNVLNIHDWSADEPSESEVVRRNGSPARRILPDVANDLVADVPGPLDRVGMSGIEVVLRRSDVDGRPFAVPGRADAFVSLDDPTAKGIHMSRLFLAVQKGFDDHDFERPVVEQMLRSFVDSHRGASSSSRLKVSFEHVVRRSALLSEHSGWRVYTVSVESEFDGERFRHRVSASVTYSSTCPCSAALSRQLLQEGFDEDFADRETVSTEEIHDWLGRQSAIRALPHAQRSHADLVVELDDTGDTFPIDSLIDLGERAVNTPVQAVVKRADEQEFARLNGANLMFCEDAARRIRVALEAADGIRDYRVEVRHLESLHPHDAVAVVTKGLEDGLRP